MRGRITSIVHRIRFFVAAFAACLAGGLPPVQAEFDPVNDDTDIFLANPEIPANRPNVIIYVDNTANWNTAFDNEKSALVSVVQNLTDSFNVGLMLFPETGGDNDSVDGGYVRFSVRQMTTTNKATLANDIVDTFDKLDDKGNNATTALGMLEAYRYFAGKASRASHGKIKTDFQNNTIYKACSSCSVTSHPATADSLGDFALDSNSSGVEYNSPIQDACQSNFIIYISNGPANENASALSVSEDELADLGYDTSTTIAITPDGQRGNWMDEWADYMANSDVDDDFDGDQFVYTYTVEVDPTTAGQGDDMTALLKSVALKGKGQYFAVSSGNAGQAIVNALNAIFQEIQAVNSVFASTTLPVSVNVRGTNLNQVYIGVFRPDEVKQPRWYGNLKMYQLGFDDATNTLFLADASGNKAENPETGFINSTSPSFWTTSSSFWGFRTADQNGPGGSSDLPDGDLVEKGGAAQQQRENYAASQALRNVYTCTSGTVDCVAGSSLSLTPFADSNDGITSAALNLGVSAVSSLTGFETKTITALSDTKAVSALSTAQGGVAVTSLDNGVVTQNISAITTTQTKSITGMSNSVTQAITSLTHPTTGSDKGVVTATVPNHGLSDGATVTISGASPSDYNGTFVIDLIDASRFTYSTSGSTSVSNDVTPATTPGNLITTSSIVTITSSGHPFESGQSVTISGVTPTDYNGTYASINVLNANQFQVTTAAPLSPITSFAGATVSGQTKTATATLTSHGYAAGAFVTVSGVSPSGYNGTVQLTAVTSNTFSYAVSSRLANGSGAPTMQVSQGSTTVTATAPGHGFNDGDIVTISGADPSGFNGSFTIFNVVPAVSFQFTTATALTANTSGSVTAASGTSGVVTATVLNHQFGSAGDIVSVKIEGVTNLPAAYNGTVSATIVDGNTFTYDTVDGSSAAPATGTTITARLAASTAFATVASHGYGNAGDTVTLTIKGATPTSYNRSDVTATVVDADTIKYPLLTVSAQGTATGTITANRKTTTAKVRAVVHGFNDGDSVTIAGASPTAFNGNFTITLVDTDNFTYDLQENDPSAAAQGDATGTITAAAGIGTGEREALIAWVRGADNFEDEDTDTVTTDIRASVHGDVLHSRPAVVNYNRHGNDDDVYIFYGANDGMFRAVKGGFNLSDPTEPEPGHEAWAFIPEEFFSKLERMRNNEPLISSSNKKPYFADGSIGTYARDDNGDGIIDPANSDADDTVQLFISMRRGGRFIYALDVSTPDDPKLLWRHSNTDTGWGELGYSWSLPRVTTIEMDHDDDDGTDPESVNVLIFGAGYDPTPEDIEPDTITDFTESKVATVTDYNRTMGRGIFIVEAETGEIIWQAGPPAADPTADPSVTQVFLEVDDMDYAIPSDVTVITDRNGTIDNRAYVGDTGGQVWRVDFADPDPEDWTVTRLALLADHSSEPDGLRKFLFPPDVVYHEDGYDAVLIGAGDREHPFDESVVNRFYMLKDEGTGTSPVTQDLDESDLFDATSNCIQDSSACDSGAGETPETALADLASADGWYITLGEGEKVVGSAVTLNNVTFFNTNQPSSSAPTSCTSDLGIARQYKVLFDDATAVADQNIDGSIDALDRATVHPGGGYLPSPVPVVVEIDGQIHEGVISGVAVDEPPGSLLNARLRKFWYREME
jgi:Tfp pilus tip-associated adhesin PilY1